MAVTLEQSAVAVIYICMLSFPHNLEIFSMSDAEKTEKTSISEVERGKYWLVRKLEKLSMS